jgi:hypothetical protein
MDADHADVHKDNEKTCNEKIPDYVVLNKDGDKFTVISFQDFEILVVADIGSFLETCAECNSHIFSIKIPQISLIVNSDSWMSSNSHPVLPLLIFS